MIYVIYILPGDDEKHRKPDGIFEKLEIVKLGGLDTISDGGLTRFLGSCPNLRYIEINNLRKLTDYVLQGLVKLPTLQKIMMNFTPEISNNRSSICV